ncbi:hypothetical protein PR048_018039 [Dryococelus australis]|uniref:Uncharacterized protein n=1 Tax=Dryococelus australis TaxID=614101 RepID=A0ABQ9HBJ3_9NEOP|nr:hypothetical protein PR048_018039 [Dryococelus australis]
MDQNVTKTLKAHYKKCLLTDIGSQPNADITSLLKQFNIKDANDNINTDFPDEEIIKEITEPVDDMIQEASEARFTVNCDEAVSAANTLLQWCEERGFDYEQIVMLKDIQDQALTDSFRKKKQKTIPDFFKV